MIIDNRLDIFINFVKRKVFSLQLRLWRLNFIRKRACKVDVQYDAKSFIIALKKLLGDFNDILRNCHIDVKEKLLNNADEYLQHKFDILGSGIFHLEPVKWDVDFKSGYIWNSKKYFLNYVIINPDNNADVKVPWELSRCHHLLILGEAYMLTKNETYAKEIICQIKSWVKSNPFMFSINWTCSMEVSIRAINWIYAINMISDSTYIDQEFINTFVRSLFQHVFFISHNLEGSVCEHNGNHYAADVMGILFISHFFKNRRDCKRWWQFALNEYYSIIRNQFFPSGFHFERSVPYHRLMSEIISYSYFMLLRLGEKIPIDIEPRIKRMFTVISSYSKANGLAPNIGDGDDGRILPFLKYDFRNHSYLLNIALQYWGWGDDEFGSIQSCDSAKFSGTIDYLFALSSIKNRHAISFSNQSLKSDDRLVIYRDIGFAIYKSPFCFLMFCNSGPSKYPSFGEIVSTHTHSDLLSFEFSLFGHDIFIDPGTGTYTSSLETRNCFRSVQMHNTVCIDNMQQYAYIGDEFFAFSNCCKISDICSSCKNHAYHISSKYDRYVNDDLVYCHGRSINVSRISDAFIDVCDYISFTGEHQATLFFHLAPEIIPICHGEQVTLHRGKSIIATVLFPIKLSHGISITKGLVSPSYGQYIENSIIALDVNFVDRLNIVTRIKW